MDARFGAQYHDYTEAKAAYARKHNYPFMFRSEEFNLPHTIMPHYYRLFATLNLMQGKTRYTGPPVDWIVYLDTDAFFVERELPLHMITQAAELFIQKFPNDPQPCDFIGQDLTEVLNSGVWFMRNTTWSQSLIDIWWKECNKRPIYKFGWFQDQGPLESALLHLISKAKGIPYDDECWKKGNPYSADICYNYTMADYGLPNQFRKFGPICLLPRNIGIPSLHHRHLRYHEGHFIRHQKNLSPEEVKQPGILKYDLEKDLLTVIPGKIISRPFYTEMFKIDDHYAKHKIANVNISEYSVIVVEDRYIDRIPNG